MEFLKVEVAPEVARAPKPVTRQAREVEEVAEMRPAREHDVRYNVDITAVEQDPVVPIDVSLPGK